MLSSVLAVGCGVNEKTDVSDNTSKEQTTQQNEEVLDTSVETVADTDTEVATESNSENVETEFPSSEKNDDKKVEKENTEPESEKSFEGQSDDINIENQKNNNVKSGAKEKVDGVNDKISLTGEWKIDVDKTNSNLKDATSIQELFGTGLSKYGAYLKIGDNNEISYSIGIGLYSEGTYKLEDNVIYADMPEENADGLDGTIQQIKVVEADGTTYLVMNCYNEEIYWVKNK